MLSIEGIITSYRSDNNPEAHIYETLSAILGRIPDNVRLGPRN